MPTDTKARSALSADSDHLSRLRGRSPHSQSAAGGGFTLRWADFQTNAPSPTSRASFARLGPPQAGEGAHRRYLNVIANPLRSAFASKPTSVPESSSTAPFWLVS